MSTAASTLTIGLALVISSSILAPEGWRRRDATAMNRHRRIRYRMFRPMFLAFFYGGLAVAMLGVVLMLTEQAG